VDSAETVSEYKTVCVPSDAVEVCEGVSRPKVRSEMLSVTSSDTLRLEGGCVPEILDVREPFVVVRVDVTDRKLGLRACVCVLVRVAFKVTVNVSLCVRPSRDSDGVCLRLRLSS
jgi:hypothetical protein